MHFIHNRRKSKSKASEPEAKQSDKSQGDSGSRTSRSGGGTFEHFRSHNPFVQEKPIHITVRLFLWLYINYSSFRIV